MLYERYLRAYAEQFRKTDRNMWNYEDGCVLIGLRALYQATGDAFYFDVLNSFMERYIEPDGTIRRYVAEEYNLDYIPPAARCIPCMTRPASRATARLLKRWKNSCATSRAPPAAVSGTRASTPTRSGSMVCTWVCRSMRLTPCGLAMRPRWMTSCCNSATHASISTTKRRACTTTPGTRQRTCSGLTQRPACPKISGHGPSAGI